VNRRSFLKTNLFGAIGLASAKIATPVSAAAEIDKSPPGEVKTGGSADKNAIRPFHVNVPEAELTELRRRINATRWPDRETVTDESQGVQLALPTSSITR
jgi:hypothetical protein